MKAGDLVRCINANGVIGLGVERRRPGATPLVFDVLLGGKLYPFLPHQLEVVSESR